MAKSTIKSIETLGQQPDEYSYRVESSSGKIYHVGVSGTVDLPGIPAEYGLLWDCDCPARGDCHHLRAVIDLRQAEGHDLIDQANANG